MKTMVITEYNDINLPDSTTFYISKMDINDCIGCWSCWWKTPGKCAFKDLDEFYRQYLIADKVMVFAKVSCGFVSGSLKTLFDRMIPNYLPYISYATGESMHYPRYDKYPDVEFYYNDEFATDEDRKIFTDYIGRVFYQFYSKNITVKSMEEFNNRGKK